MAVSSHRALLAVDPWAAFSLLPPHSPFYHFSSLLSVVSSQWLHAHPWQRQQSHPLGNSLTECRGRVGSPKNTMVLFPEAGEEMGTGCNSNFPPSRSPLTHFWPQQLVQGWVWDWGSFSHWECPTHLLRPGTWVAPHFLDLWWCPIMEPIMLDHLPRAVKCRDKDYF